MTNGKIDLFFQHLWHVTECISTKSRNLQRNNLWLFEVMKCWIFFEKCQFTITLMTNDFLRILNNFIKDLILIWFELNWIELNWFQWKLILQSLTWNYFTIFNFLQNSRIFSKSWKTSRFVFHFRKSPKVNGYAKSGKNKGYFNHIALLSRPLESPGSHSLSSEVAQRLSRHPGIATSARLETNRYFRQNWYFTPFHYLFPNFSLLSSSTMLLWPSWWPFY